jgi:hypothetical protein
MRSRYSAFAAALVEGALTFVVKYARTKQIGPFGSSNFERGPHTWRIDDLVSSAASGGPLGILDRATRSERTAELVVRSVLDWLERFPPSP